MESNVILLIGLVAFCGFVCQVSSEDGDCDVNVDLGLVDMRVQFIGEEVIVTWDLNTPTNCSVEYHVTVTDSQLGVIVDEYLEDKIFRLDALSACISYSARFRAVNKAVPTSEGPVITITIQFYPKAQIAPTLQSLDINTTSISTTWFLEGKRNRCPLKNFYVNGGTAFNFTIPLEDLEDPSVVPVVINSLKPDSMYYFRVAVENSGGISNATPIAVQTLHE